MEVSERKVDVTILRSTGERKSEFKGVTSIMEIPDEENETIKGVSIYAPTPSNKPGRLDYHWKDINLEDVDEIRIKPQKARGR